MRRIKTITHTKTKMKTETTKKRIRNSFEVSLTPRQQRALDRKAKADGISKSAVIRDAITFYCC